MASLQDRPLAGADEFDTELMPADFHAARDAIRQGIARTVAADIAETTTLAVLLAETLPRLINAYGPAQAAVILSRLAHDIGAGVAPNCKPQ